MRLSTLLGPAFLACLTSCSLLFESGSPSVTGGADGGQDASMADAGETCSVQEALECDPRVVAEGCPLSSLHTDFGQASWTTFWSNTSSADERDDIEFQCSVIQIPQARLAESKQLEIRARSAYHAADTSLTFRLKATESEYFGAYVSLYGDDSKSRLRLELRGNSVKWLHHSQAEGSGCQAEGNDGCSGSFGSVPIDVYFKLRIDIYQDESARAGAHVSILDDGGSLLSKTPTLIPLYFGSLRIQPAFGMGQDSNGRTNTLFVDRVDGDFASEP